MDWDQKIIQDCLEEIEKQKKIPGFFSIASISNVPFVSYPDLTKQECKIVQEQIKNVLRISRNENNYKEVAITYSLSDSITNRKYIKVLGDYTSVPIMKDNNTSNIINKMNKSQDLVIISIHNHPNNSNFSISDLLIFSENPSIKLMIIVNHEGKISFLQRPNLLDLSKIVIKNIIDYVPDLNTRIDDFKKENEGKEYNIINFLNTKECKKIVQESISQFQLKGIYYSNYIDQTDAKNLVFKCSSSEQEVLLFTSFNKNEHNLNINNLESESDDYDDRDE